MKKSGRISGNILQADYDWVLEGSTETCCMEISQQEVRMLLAMTEYFQWPTRWFSDIGTPIDPTVIKSLAFELDWKLMNICCTPGGGGQIPPIQPSYTPDGVYQTVSPTTGVLTDNPLADPRRGTPQLPPAPADTGDQILCYSSIHVRDQMEVIRDGIVTALSVPVLYLDFLLALAASLGVFLFAVVTGNAYILLLYEVASDMLYLGSEGVAGALTDDLFDIYQCIFYCHADSNGQLSYDGWQAMFPDIDIAFSDFPKKFFHALTAALGMWGLNNMARVGGWIMEESCDCACGECEDEIPAGTHTYTVNASGGFRVLSGTPATSGQIEYSAGAWPYQEILVRLCSATDMTVGIVSMENQLLPASSEAATPMRYGVRVRLADDTVVAERIFWENNTWGYGWFADSHDFAGAVGQKIEWFGQQVKAGVTWEFRAMTAVTT